MNAAMRQQIIRVVLQVGDAGALIAQGRNQLRDMFQRFIRRGLLTEDSVHRRLKLIFHILGLSGNIPKQLLQSLRIFIILLEISLHHFHDGIECSFNLSRGIGLISCDVTPNFVHLQFHIKGNG